MVIENGTVKKIGKDDIIHDTLKFPDEAIKVEADIKDISQSVLKKVRVIDFNQVKGFEYFVQGVNGGATGTMVTPCVSIVFPNLYQLIAPHLTEIKPNFCFDADELIKADISGADKIGKNAFCRCKKLEWVNIYSSNDVGQCAFLDCYKLKDVIGLSCTINGQFYRGKISGEAFAETAISDIYLHDIGQAKSDSFEGCTKLKDIYVLDNSPSDNYAYFWIKKGACYRIHTNTRMERFVNAEGSGQQFILSYSQEIDMGMYRKIYTIKTGGYVVRKGEDAVLLKTAENVRKYLEKGA